MQTIRADILNRQCHCLSLDRSRLEANLRRHHPDIARLILEERPNLFANHAVFLDQSDYQLMQQLIETVERCTTLPEYQQQALARHGLPPTPQHREKGGFLSFDFHLSPEGPKLIEINTNPGGVLLNAWLLEAAIPCCPEIGLQLTETLSGLRKSIVDMFIQEWHLAGHEGEPRQIAIVDDAPEQQYLYPEFLMFRELFESRGWAGRIADVASLDMTTGAPLVDGQPVDMIYNRCTDFYLSDQAHDSLKKALALRAAVISPHPEAHALYADKRNFIWLTDARRLASAGLSSSDKKILTDTIPETKAVSTDVDWWSQRKQWFFKPAAGFGGRAAYRGDKLTKGTLEEILSGDTDYIAQKIVPPSERRITADDSNQPLKTDFRIFAYAGKPLLAAARLYQGQTTNFRTPGGGFAPVFIIQPQDRDDSCETPPDKS